MTSPSKGSSLAAGYALLSVILVFSWQFVNVGENFDGRWSALYITGDRFEGPPALASEDTYVYPGSDGYDGQFYHYIAHDPLMSKGFARYVDAPGLRWRRILVPGLAALLAFGNQQRVDSCYLLVVYAFIAAGVFWLASLAALFGRNPAWGLAFVAVPAVAISIERLTVDVAVTALTVGYVYYATRGKSAGVWAVLALAPLARETGLGLLAVHAAYALFTRRWNQLAGVAACSLPFAAWAAFVASQAPPVLSGWLGFPLYGLLRRTYYVAAFRLEDMQAIVATALDYAGVIGVWLALAQTVLLLRGATKPLGPVQWGLVVWGAAGVMLASPLVWATTYSFARVLSPWLIFLLAVALKDRRPWLAAPTVLMSLHVAAQAAVNCWAIIRRLA